MKRAHRWILSVSAVLIAAAIFSGCSPTPPATLELTGKDSGSHQTLAVGQKLAVSLESNPTTGYRWALDGALPPVLRREGEPAYTSSSSLPGAGGTEVWTFVGVSAGSGTLKLKYWRSFEPTATPPQSFEVSVDVK